MEKDSNGISTGIRFDFCVHPFPPSLTSSVYSTFQEKEIQFESLMMIMRRNKRREQNDEAAGEETGIRRTRGREGRKG